MFSILNEIKDPSPKSTTAVVTASIGTSASIYILVAITGYLTFGDHVVGNIVSQCISPTQTRFLSALTVSRSPIHLLDHWQGCNCSSCHVLLPLAGASLQSLSRCCAQMADIKKPLYLYLSCNRLSFSRRSSRTRQRWSCSAYRDERSKIRGDYYGHHYPQLHCRHDSFVARKGSGLRWKHWKHFHQLHFARLVLLQDLIAGLALAPEIDEGR